MTRRRFAPAGAVLALASLFVLAGCADDGSATTASSTTDTVLVERRCAEAVEAIGSATQRYVNGYEGGRVVSADAGGDEGAAGTSSTADADSEVLDEVGFQEALDAANEEIRAAGCDPTALRAELGERLDQVRPEGPVADAVLRRVSAQLTGELLPAADEISVGPGDDLRDVLARIEDGTVVRLDPGEHRLDGTLVLLAGVELRGAGRDDTSIVSTAPDAAVLALTDELVAVQSLTIRHDGDAPASVVLAGQAASIRITDARVSGGVADADGFGGAGVLMFSDPEADRRGTTLEMTDVEVVSNEAGGVVLTGAHRSSIVRARISENVQCGICFLDGADGSVEDATFAGNGVGVAATGAAAPSLLRVVVEGGEVGVQVADDAKPRIAGATLTGAARAALIYSGRAGGSLSDVTCADVPFGLVVGPQTHPAIEDVDCDVVPAPE